MEPPSIALLFTPLALLSAPTPEVILAIGVQILLLFFSATISASEVAFFSLSHSDRVILENDNAKTAQRILRLLRMPEQLLATILVANNFVNISIVILSTFIISDVVDFTGYPVWLPFTIQVLAVTFILLLLGEVLPKVYATNSGLKICRVMALPLTVIEKVFKPISYLLVSSTNLINKRIRKRGTEYSSDHLVHALELTRDHETTPGEERILKGIVRFGSTDAKQIMTPRTEVIGFDDDTPFAELLTGLLEQGYSRVPVFSESIDKVKGILYLKDLLPYADQDNFEWQILLRKAFFVPENKKLDDLLKEFQSKKIHMAVVVDEYGGTSGIVTLEDVIEEIVGDIADDFDDEEIFYSRLDDRTYVFEGKTPLVDIYKVLDINGEDFEEAKGESDTLAGFIIELTGKIPAKNEKLKFDNYIFTIEAADKRKVKRVKLSIQDLVESDGNK